MYVGCTPFFLYASSSLILNCSLEDDLCEAIGSCDVTLPFQLPFSHYCEKVFMWTNVVLNCFADFLVGDVVGI